MTMLLYEEMTKAMEALSEKLNFTLTTTTGELDADKYIPILKHWLHRASTAS